MQLKDKLMNRFSLLCLSIASLSLSPPAASVAATPMNTAEHAGWYPFAPQNDNSPNSVIGLNAWMEKPAGKRGGVLMRGDHFVPYSHDQPDNAARIVRLGVGRTVRRARYTPALAARELQHLLRDSRYAEKARLLGGRIRAEDGARAACDAIEEYLH